MLREEGVLPPGPLRAFQIFHMTNLGMLENKGVPSQNSEKSLAFEYQNNYQSRHVKMQENLENCR